MGQERHAAERVEELNSRMSVARVPARDPRWGELLALSSVEFTIEQDPARMRPSDVPESVCDASRLRAATGWQPQRQIQETLRDLLDYWRKNVQKD